MRFYLPFLAILLLLNTSIYAQQKPDTDDGREFIVTQPGTTVKKLTFGTEQKGPQANNSVTESLTPGEGFESLPFPPTGWDTTILNPGITTTQGWTRLSSTTTGNGAYGMSFSAAKFDFFNISNNSRQYLQTSNFPATVSGEVLRFDWSYAPYINNARDTVIIQVSSDGVNFTDLFIMYGDTTNTMSNPQNMVTAIRNATAYTPTDAQWATKELALPVGTVAIRLLAIANFGNNFYIDNILTYVPSGSPLSGTYTINFASPTGGSNFQTFRDAADALNFKGISGPVTFNVAAGTYGSGNRFYLNAIVGSSSSNTIKFQASGGEVIMSDTATLSASDFLVFLNGTDWVTFDGINLRDASIGLNGQINRGYYLSAYRGIDGARNNTIKNCRITLGGVLTPPGASIGILGTGAIGGSNVATTPTQNVVPYPSGSCDSTTIQNIRINKSDRGIGFFVPIPSVSPLASVYSVFHNKIEISNCILGDSITLGSTTSPNAIGIIPQGCRNINIFNNRIDSVRNILTASTVGVTGIALQTSSGRVYNNTIKYLQSATTTSTTPILTGIQAGPCLSDTLYIYNNFVSGLVKGYTSTATAVNLSIGMQVTNFGANTTTAAGINISNNTILMTAPTTVTYSSAALLCGNTGLTYNVNNNYFSNITSTTTATVKSLGIGDLSTSRVLLRSNYNNIYVSGTNASIGGINAALTISSTLAAWKTSSTGDTNSVSGPVTYSSFSPLTVDNTVPANWVLNGKGIALPFVTSDINGNPRNSIITQGTTDIGANEFNMGIAPPFATESAAPTSGGTSLYTQFGDTVCIINWGTGGTYPTGLNISNYTGESPPNSGTTHFTKSYVNIAEVGGPLSGTTYDITSKFGYNQYYNLTNPPADIRMTKQSGTFWTAYLTAGSGAGESDVNSLGRRVTVRGLTSLSNFALTDITVPLNTQALAPNLIFPANNATNIATTLNFTWNKSAEVPVDNMPNSMKKITGSGESIGNYWFELSSDTNSASLIKDSTLTDTIKNVSGLSNSTNYWWKVRARNQNGWGSFSAWNKFTTVIAAPVAPALSSPSNGATGIALTPLMDWNDVSGAASYRIQIATDAGFTNIVKDTAGVLSSQYQVLGGALNNNTQYFWKVSATNAGGTSAYSTAFNFTTIVAAPAAPTLLTPTNGATNVSITPTLDWSDVSGAATYRVQISTNSGFTAIIKDSAGLSASQFVVGSGVLGGNTTYYWRALATNAGGSSSFTSGFSFTTIPAAPSVPTLLTPTNGASGVALTPLLDWNDVSGATSYQIQISTNAGFTAIIKDTSGVLSSQYQVLGGLFSNNTQYYWRVNATNAGGTSAFTSAFNFTTIVAAPSTPTLLTPANGASGVALTPVLDWNDVSGAASYRIQISTNAGFTAIIKDTAGVLSSQYQVLGGLLSNNTQYFWRVNATNAGGTSSYTSGFSFTTIVSAPVAPTLSAPANNATGVSVTPLFDWSDVLDAINKEIGSGSLEGGPSTTYRIQISTNAGFTAIVKDTSGIPASQYQIPGGILNNSTQYFWRVNATNAGGTSSYSTVFNFTTLPLPPAQVQFTIIPGGLYNSSTGRLNMRDTVKVYLIDSANCLKMDSAIGVVDSVTFGMTLNFSNAPTGKYYFYAMHRNHIVTASRLTQTVTRGSLVSYNFTTANNQAFGNNMIQVSSSPVRWGMIPGDGNRDGFVDGLDQTIWIIQNGLDGYFSGDFNGDGFVDGLDQTLWIVQNGQSYILPCIILDTPVNIKDLENFINVINPVLSPGIRKTK